MTDKFLHETTYRGTSALAKLRALPVTICGGGALGSHLTDNLARQGFETLRVIDRDRVEEHNVNTQLYGAADVGAWKVEVLRNRVFRSVDLEIETYAKELSQRSARSLLKGSRIVIDTLDNSASRQLVQDYCRQHRLDCLHVGLYADYAEVIWDDEYRVPQDVGGDVCEYPLARNLVLLAVSLAAETLIRFILEEERLSRSVTLRDFAVHRLGE